MGWKRLLEAAYVEILKYQVRSLEKRHGRRPGQPISVWKMRKEQLVEVGRKELGLTLVQAEAMTVVTLRERIRSQREVNQMTTDPLETNPKGLDRMKHQDLLEECIKRNLPCVQGLPTRPGEKGYWDPPTRPHMINAIKDDVETRKLLRTSLEQEPTQNESGATASSAFPDSSPMDIQETEYLSIETPRKRK